MICDQVNFLNKPGALEDTLVGIQSECPELAAAFGFATVSVGKKLKAAGTHIAVGDVVHLDDSIYGMVCACISTGVALHIILDELVVKSRHHLHAFNMVFNRTKSIIDVGRCKRIRHASCWADAQHGAILVIM